MNTIKLTLLFCILQLHLTANNIKVDSVSLKSQNIATDQVSIEFDLAWENSWRLNAGPANWDAAWIFVKFRVNSGPWSHARLNYVNGSSDGHSGPSTTTIKTPDDALGYGLGVFAYRSTPGSGDVNWKDIRLLWNYGLNGVGDNDQVDVQVFAIEMVYVPQGNFRVGDGASANRFFSYPFSNIPFYIQSENQITVGISTGNLYYLLALGSSGGDQLGPIPTSFPKGYQSFYSMKYEVTQGQYVDFFNTLTPAQKTTRDLTDANHKNSDATVARNTISYNGGGMSTTTPNRALNYVGTDDALAYLDWAGLRLLTELEFQKSARGTVTPVPGEFAWGNANIATPLSPYIVYSDGQPYATIANPEEGVGNAIYSATASGFGGPFRVGIVASSAIQKNREETGASFYGIMELSGNLYERYVSVGTPGGRAYTGKHGDGILTTNGDRNVTNWPADTGGHVGYFGASYANGYEYLRISDRFDAANTSNIVNSRIGFRGGRTNN